MVGEIGSLGGEEWSNVVEVLLRKMDGIGKWRMRYFHGVCGGAANGPEVPLLNEGNYIDLRIGK